MTPASQLASEPVNVLVHVVRLRPGERRDERDPHRSSLVVAQEQPLVLELEQHLVPADGNRPTEHAKRHRRRIVVGQEQLDVLVGLPVGPRLPLAPRRRAGKDQTSTSRTVR